MAMEINSNYSNYAGSFVNAVNRKKQTAEGAEKYDMYSAAITKAESDKTFKMGTATREATGNGDGKNIEMFALMSHLDETGQSRNEGMSSFSKMRTYSKQAESDGFCSGIADADKEWDSKRNWTEIIGNARKAYSKSLIPGIYALTRKCDSLLNVMQKWIEDRKFSNIGIS